MSGRNLISTPATLTPANSLQQPSTSGSYHRRSIEPYPGSSPLQNGFPSYVPQNSMNSFGAQQTPYPQTPPMGMNGSENMGMGLPPMGSIPQPALSGMPQGLGMNMQPMNQMGMVIGQNASMQPMNQMGMVMGNNSVPQSALSGMPQGLGMNMQPMNQMGMGMGFDSNINTGTPTMGMGMNVSENMGMGLPPMGMGAGNMLQPTSSMVGMGMNGSENMGMGLPPMGMGAGNMPQPAPSMVGMGMNAPVNMGMGFDPNINTSTPTMGMGMGMGMNGLGNISPSLDYPVLPEEFGSFAPSEAIGRFTSLPNSNKDFKSSFDLGRDIGEAIIQNPGTSIDEYKHFLDGFTKKQVRSPENMTGFWQGILSTCFAHYDESLKEKLAEFAFDNILEWSSREGEDPYDNVAKIITSFRVSKTEFEENYTLPDNAVYIDDDDYKQTESTAPTVLMGYMFKAISKKPDFRESFFQACPDAPKAQTVEASTNASSKLSYNARPLDIPDKDKPLWFQIAMHCLFKSELKEDYYQFAIKELNIISVQTSHRTKDFCNCSMLGILHITVAKSLTIKKGAATSMNFTTNKNQFNGRRFYFYSKKDWDCSEDKGVQFYRDIIQPPPVVSIPLPHGSPSTSRVPTPPQTRQDPPAAEQTSKRSFLGKVRDNITGFFGKITGFFRKKS